MSTISANVAESVDGDTTKEDGVVGGTTTIEKGDSTSTGGSAGTEVIETEDQDDEGDLKGGVEAKDLIKRGIGGTKKILSRVIHDTKSTTKTIAQKTTSTLHQITDRVVTTTTKAVGTCNSQSSNDETKKTEQSNEKKSNEESVLETISEQDGNDADEIRTEDKAVDDSTKGNGDVVTAVTTKATTITLHPVMDFMTADMSLIFLFTFITACCTTYEYYYTMNGPHSIGVVAATNVNKMLLKLLVPWMISSFTFGLAIGQYFSTTDSILNWFLPNSASSRTSSSESNTVCDAVESETVIESDEGEVDEPSNVDKNHSLFMTLLGPGRSSRIQFRSSLKKNPTTTVRKTNWMGGKRKQQNQLVQNEVKCYTTLNCKNLDRKSSNASFQTSSDDVGGTEQQQQRRFKVKLPTWQKNINPTNDGFLIQNLLKHKSFRRVVVRKASTISSTNSTNPAKVNRIDEATTTTSMDDSESTSGEVKQRFGSMELSVADTLNDYVIEPIFHLRGMDIFLTDDVPPETESSTHPFLIESGLRSVPTFVVNILTQWGNIFIYFEMPSWVRSLTLVEEESDPDDVKALKRFLSGDDKYRNERLKMIPSLVNGPMPIRVMAPPKREKVVHCDWMPITWNKREEETDSNGNVLRPVLEAVLDCMTSRTIRSIAGLVKKYLHLLSVDVAVVIGTPDGQTDIEPSACLGMWRFHHIEIANSPQLPDRYIEETTSSIVDDEDASNIDRVVSADIHRASICISAISTGIKAN